MKVNTVEQYKVLEYIKDNFVINDVIINIVDDKSLIVTDKSKNSIIFTYDGEKIIFE